MAITKTDVRLIAPELTDTADATLDAAIADAYAQMDPETWGAQYDLGAKYLAASIATSYGRGGSSGSEVAAGPVIERKVGPVSIRYATSGGEGASAGGQTSARAETYFQTYNRLLRNLPFARFVVA